MGKMHILGRQGDNQVIWDPQNALQTEAVRAAFNGKIADGFTAFRVGPGGLNDAEQLAEFDPHAQRIVLVPQIVGG
jgi:hypothetical protein